MELFVLLLLFLLLTGVATLIGKCPPAQLPPVPRLKFLQTKLQKYSTILILIFALLMVVTIFGRATGAQWSVIDDHEIMYFLGRDGKLSAGEIMSTLSLTEVGNFGLQERFRPSYYFLRIVECMFWGANPFDWHLVRLVILWLGISLTWYLVSERLGWLGAGIFCAYILTFPFWADTIGKLGAGETYAVLALPVYIWGVVRALKPGYSMRSQILAGLLIFIGSVICLGSKENFMLLLIPSAFVAWMAFRKHQYVLFLFAMGSVAFGILVGAAVVLLISNAGTDVYQNNISLFTRLQVLLDALTSDLHFPTLVILLFLILALIALLFVHGIPVEKKTSIKRTIFWMVALLAVYCSQLIFYNGVWPRANRYDFPGILYIPLTVYVLCTLSEEMIGSVRQIPVSRNALQTIFSSALLLMVITKGYGGIVEQISEYVDATNRFTSSMKELSLVLEQNPDHALVLESNDLWQYEPVTSTQRFLQVYGAQPPMFLRLHCYSRETGRTVQERFLAADLERISSQGNALFLPLSHLKEYQDRCYSLNLSNYEFSPCADQAEIFLKCRNNQ